MLELLCWFIPFAQSERIYPASWLLTPVSVRVMGLTNSENMIANIFRYGIENSHGLYRSSFEFQGPGFLLFISHALANNNSPMPFSRLRSLVGAAVVGAD